jgi:hypothetical protein
MGKTVPLDMLLLNKCEQSNLNAEEGSAQNPCQRTCPVGHK